jgi:peptidoglycan/LPS O-acetylase OafA/YrhL
LSILLVLSAHSDRVSGHPAFLDLQWVHMLNDGDLGVRCFFTISGLLITWLLLVEHDAKGRVSLKRFYLRRALRILPVCFALLTVLLCLQLWTPFHQTVGTWIANFTFTTNYFPGSWCSGHLWSLSVEEQFYLLWPGLFVLGRLADRPGVALRLLCLPLLIAPACRLMTYKGYYPEALAIVFAPFSFFNYFDCLAIGCISAILLRHHRKELQAWLMGRPMLAAGVGLAALALPYLLARSDVPGRLVLPSKPTFQAIGISLLLLQSILLPRSGFYRGLNWKWICHLGVLSYSLYIWQQLFCADPATYGLSAVWWLSFPGWLVPVFATACASYYLLERPLFRLRSRFR